MEFKSGKLLYFSNWKHTHTHTPNCLILFSGFVPKNINHKTQLFDIQQSKQTCFCTVYVVSIQGHCTCMPNDYSKTHHSHKQIKSFKMFNDRSAKCVSPHYTNGLPTRLNWVVVWILNFFLDYIDQQFYICFFSPSI